MAEVVTFLVLGIGSGGLIFTGGLVTYALEDWFGLQGEWFSLAAALLLIIMLAQPRGLATAIFYRDTPAARSLPWTRRRTPGELTPRWDVGP